MAERPASTLTRRPGDSQERPAVTGSEAGAIALREPDGAVIPSIGSGNQLFPRRKSCQDGDQAIYFDALPRAEPDRSPR